MAEVGPILRVILVNVILSGDNALMISLAVHRLPRAQRRRAIVLGTLCAFVLQTVLTLIASVLLLVPGLMIAAGVLLFLIACSLVHIKHREPVAAAATQTGSTWSAVRRIMVVNCLMSLDNILGVAATSRGEPVAMVLGLLVSISVITAFSAALSGLMHRYPWLPVAGALLVAFIAADRIVGDRDLGRMVVTEFNVSLNSDWDQRMATRAELETFAGSEALPPPIRSRIQVRDGVVTFAGVMSEADRDALLGAVASNPDRTRVERMYEEARWRPPPRWAPAAATGWLTERVQVKWPPELWAKARDNRYPWVGAAIQGGFVFALIGYTGFIRRKSARAEAPRLAECPLSP
jgi:YjbE family integral membrane protein